MRDQGAPSSCRQTGAHTGIERRISAHGQERARGHPRSGGGGFPEPVGGNDWFDKVAKMAKNGSAVWSV